MAEPTLNDDLAALAVRVEPINHDLAARLRNLGSWVQAGRHGELAHLELRAVMDPATIEAQALDYFGRAPGWLPLLAGARLALALLALALVGWQGAQALVAYARAAAADPFVGSQPFLLLWQQGFGGIAGAPMPLSQVVLGTVALLALALLVTLFLHAWRMRAAQQAHAQAAHLRRQVEQLFWKVSYLFAEEQYQRGHGVAQASQSMTRAVNQFERHVQELLDLLSFERKRQAEIATQREEEVSHLRAFSTGLSEGSEKLLRYGQGVERIGQQLEATVARLTEQVETMGGRQASLLAALEGLGGHSAALLDTTRTTSAGLTRALDALHERREEERDALALVSGAVEELRGVALVLLEREGSLRDALAGVGQEVQAAYGGFAQVAEQHATVATNLDRIGGELRDLSRANQQLAEQVVALTSQQQASAAATTEALAETTAQTLATLRELAERTTATLANSSATSAARLQEAGERATEALAETTAQNAARLHEVGERTHRALATASEQNATLLQEMAGSTTRVLSESAGRTADRLATLVDQVAQFTETQAHQAEAANQALGEAAAQSAAILQRLVAEVAHFTREQRTLAEGTGQALAASTAQHEAILVALQGSAEEMRALATRVTTRESEAQALLAEVNKSLQVSAKMLYESGHRTGQLVAHLEKVGLELGHLNQSNQQLYRALMARNG